MQTELEYARWHVVVSEGRTHVTVALGFGLGRAGCRECALLCALRGQTIVKALGIHDAADEGGAGQEALVEQLYRLLRTRPCNLEREIALTQEAYDGAIVAAEAVIVEPRTAPLRGCAPPRETVVEKMRQAVTRGHHSCHSRILVRFGVGCLGCRVRRHVGALPTLARIKRLAQGQATRDHGPGRQALLHELACLVRGRLGQARGEATFPEHLPRRGAHRLGTGTRARWEALGAWRQRRRRLAGSAVAVAL